MALTPGDGLDLLQAVGRHNDILGTGHQLRGGGGGSGHQLRGGGVGVLQNNVLGGGGRQRFRTYDFPIL